MSPLWQARHRLPLLLQVSSELPPLLPREDCSDSPLSQQERVSSVRRRQPLHREVSSALSLSSLPQVDVSFLSLS